MKERNLKEMQKQLKKELKNKQLNTKSGLKIKSMTFAKNWLTTFSNKHNNQSKTEFNDWINT